MIVLGKYKEIYHNDSFPSVSDFISNEEMENKTVILDYLRKGKVTAASPARIVDVISGERIDVSLKMLEDDEYAWRSDLVYYFEKYNLKLSDDFIAHVMSKVSE